jgi:hypothetical protein
MSDKRIAEKFTDERYLSRSELPAAMGTSLVDGYWNEITSYRAKYAHKLGFRTIGNLGFYYTGTPVIEETISSATGMLTRIVNTMKKLERGKIYDLSERALLLPSMKSLAASYGGKVDELTVKAMMNGTYRGDGQGDDAPILAYQRAIRHYLSTGPSKPDDEFLGEAYESLHEGEELLTFYRTRDFDASAQRNLYVMGAVFNYAPHAMVEPLMDEFFSFIAATGISPLVKALAALYFLDYVKPLNDKNLEAASLLSLDIMASADLGAEAFYLPLMTLLDKTPEYERAFRSVQSTGDLTYYLVYACKRILSAGESLLEELKSIKIDDIREESHPLGEAEVQAAQDKGLMERKEPTSIEQLSIFGGPGTPVKTIEPEPVKPAEAPKPAPAPAPEPAKAEAAPAEPSPKPAQNAPLPKVSPEDVAAGNEGEGISLNKPESPLSEKEIREYVLYLLESNPNLNRKRLRDGPHLHG